MVCGKGPWGAPWPLVLKTTWLALQKHLDEYPSWENRFSFEALPSLGRRDCFQDVQVTYSQHLQTFSKHCCSFILLVFFSFYSNVYWKCVEFLFLFFFPPCPRLCYYNIAFSVLFLAKIKISTWVTCTVLCNWLDYSNPGRQWKQTAGKTENNGMRRKNTCVCFKWTDDLGRLFYCNTIMNGPVKEVQDNCIYFAHSLQCGVYQMSADWWRLKMSRFRVAEGERGCVRMIRQKAFLISCLVYILTRFMFFSQHSVFNFCA